MAGLPSRFGGVWKSFAVEFPVKECLDEAGRFVVFHEGSGSLTCWQGLEHQHFGDGWWWLDRRIPKKLLPEEAFDLVKVLQPNARYLKRCSVPGWLVGGKQSRVEVEWGDCRIYSPVGSYRWVNVTRENWLSYLHWNCLYGVSYEGGEGKLIGLTEGGQFVLLVAGGGVAFSSEVRAKVGLDGKSALVVMEPVLDPLACDQMREQVGLSRVLEFGANPLAAKEEKEISK